MLTDYDLHLLGEGKHWKSYDKLGAQLCTLDGKQGVHFAIWAPNAQTVSVVGDFNNWAGHAHTMSKLIPSGIWHLFVSGVKPGNAYKFRVQRPRALLTVLTPTVIRQRCPHRLLLLSQTYAITPGETLNGWNKGYDETGLVSQYQSMKFTSAAGSDRQRPHIAG